MENTVSSEKAEAKKRQLSNLKPFVKGDSRINRTGLNRDPLKQFQREQFSKMTRKEKAEFLKKVDALDRWKMAEGSPHSTTELSGKDGNPLAIVVFDESFKKRYESTGESKN